MRSQIPVFCMIAFAMIIMIATESPIIKITKVDGDKVSLDSGTLRGLKDGLKGRVYYELTVSGEIKRIYIANIKLTSVESDKSIAMVEDKTKDVVVGHFVEFKDLIPPGQRFSIYNFISRRCVYLH